MKKFYMLAISLLVIVIMSSVVLANGEKTRYYITPNNELNDKILRSFLTVIHDFDNRFSAEITDEQLVFVNMLAKVEPVQIYYILGKPRPSRLCYPNTQKPYGIQMVNGGSGGAGVKVAVLDTGANVNHPDLKISLCKNAQGAKVSTGCDDLNGHGTHVIGTVGAYAGDDAKGIYGVAPEATLWMITVCNLYGMCYSDDVARGIYYATNQGTNIISMSLGGSADSEIENAVKYAYGKGVLIVAAAGNSGPGYNTIVYPAAYVEVVAVGAIDSNKNVASFSSRGINDGDYIVEAREVEFGAPGVDVYSTNKNLCYDYKSGTSMATPHIAGLAAKLWQGSASATREYMHELAKQNDLDGLGDDPATGFGLPVAP